MPSVRDFAAGLARRATDGVALAADGLQTAALAMRGIDVAGERKTLDIFVDHTSIPQMLRPYASVDGLSSNVVMAPVAWIMRTFTEAVPRVQRRGPDGRLWDWVTDHELELLLERPNPWYDGSALMKAVVLSYVMGGNAYLLKVRNRYNAVVQLWYLPHWMMTPMSALGREPLGAAPLVGYWQYVTGLGAPARLHPDDVVHLRFGIDPEDMRLGLSPLGTLWREIATDDEAARFSERVLANMGIPGLIVSPKKDAMRPSPAETQKLEDHMRSAFVGEKRGMPLVMGMPTDVHQFGFDPNKLILPALRDISEERVCAVIGIPAAVVGFGSGLQSTKVGATMQQLVRLAWVTTLLPMQRDVGRQLTAQLMPEFQTQARRFRVRFDTQEVSGFAEEEDARAARFALLTAGGILRVDRAQAALGLEVDPSRAIYLGPAPAPDEPPEPPAGAPRIPAAVMARLGAGRTAHNGNGGGNGTGDDDEEDEGNGKDRAASEVKYNPNHDELGRFSEGPGGGGGASTDEPASDRPGRQLREGPEGREAETLVGALGRPTENPTVVRAIDRAKVPRDPALPDTPENEGGRVINANGEFTSPNPGVRHQYTGPMVKDAAGAKMPPAVAAFAAEHRDSEVEWGAIYASDGTELLVVTNNMTGEVRYRGNLDLAWGAGYMVHNHPGHGSGPSGNDIAAAVGLDIGRGIIPAHDFDGNDVTYTWEAPRWQELRGRAELATGLTIPKSRAATARVVGMIFDGEFAHEMMVRHGEAERLVAGGMSEYEAGERVVRAATDASMITAGGILHIPITRHVSTAPARGGGQPRRPGSRRAPTGAPAHAGATP